MKNPLLKYAIVFRTISVILSTTIVISACDTRDSPGAANTAPIADDQDITIDEDTAVIIVLGSDADNDMLTYSTSIGPAHGTLSGTAPDIIYTPDADYNGNDSFTFLLNDGWLDSNSGTVNIAIDAVNDPPIAENGILNPNYDKMPSSAILTGSDIEGDTLFFKILTRPTKGSVVLYNPTIGEYTYTPNTIGADSFTFNINDGDRDSDLATISISYLPPAAPPPTPTTVTATSGDQRVSISWDYMEYAESYNIYWSNATGTGTSGTKVAGVSRPFYHDGLTNTTAYYYVVTAVNTLGESSPSAEASATPADILISSLNFGDDDLKTCVDATGATYVHDLTDLDCAEKDIREITGIQALTSLTRLDLGDISVSDNVLDNRIRDISHLSGLTNLEILILEHNLISDLCPLSGLKNLTNVDLSENSISDLCTLFGLESLVDLRLSDNNIIDIGPLFILERLTSLGLDDNNIIDISPLSGLKNLINLRLNNNNIIDVSPLSGLENLINLYLYGNSIGGQGVGNVDALVTLTNAARINLYYNIGMSCGEMNTLIDALNGSATVVSPDTAIHGSTCTNP